MMKTGIKTVLAFSLLTSSLTYAETYQVKMENSGPIGKMAFEPSFLHIQPGDSVHFINGTTGHNAMTINYMIPKGAETFHGGINEEITVKLTTKGIYGIECLPHFSLGMVMLIQVGDDANLSNFPIPDSLPKYAKQRFNKIISQQINAQ